MKITLQKFKMFARPHCDQSGEVGSNNLLNPPEFNKN